MKLFRYLFFVRGKPNPFYALLKDVGKRNSLTIASCVLFLLLYVEGGGIAGSALVEKKPLVKASQSPKVKKPPKKITKKSKSRQRQKPPHKKASRQRIIFLKSLKKHRKYIGALSSATGSLPLLGVIYYVAQNKILSKKESWVKDILARRLPAAQELSSDDEIVLVSPPLKTKKETKNTLNYPEEDGFLWDIAQGELRLDKKEVRFHLEPKKAVNSHVLIAPWLVEKQYNIAIKKNVGGTCQVKEIKRQTCKVDIAKLLDFPDKNPFVQLVFVSAQGEIVVESKPLSIEAWQKKCEEEMIALMPPKIFKAHLMEALREDKVKRFQSLLDETSLPIVPAYFFKKAVKYAAPKCVKFLLNTYKDIEIGKIEIKEKDGNGDEKIRSPLTFCATRNKKRNLARYWALEEAKKKDKDLLVLDENVTSGAKNFYNAVSTIPKEVAHDIDQYHGRLLKIFKLLFPLPHDKNVYLIAYATALMYQDKEILKLFRAKPNHGIPLENVKGEKAESLLICAIEGKNLEELKWLANYKDVTLKELNYAAHVGTKEIITWLVDKKKISVEESTVDKAIQGDHPQVVEFIIKKWRKKKKKKLFKHKAPKPNIIVLQKAVQWGSLRTIDLFWTKNKLDESERLFTMLKLAVRSGQLDVLNHLVRNYVDGYVLSLDLRDILFIEAIDARQYEMLLSMKKYYGNPRRETLQLAIKLHKKHVANYLRKQYAYLVN